MTQKKSVGLHDVLPGDKHEVLIDSLFHQLHYANQIIYRGVQVSEGHSGSEIFCRVFNNLVLVIEDTLKELNEQK